MEITATYSGVRTLENTGVSVIHACFGNAFRNYFVPIEMTLEQFDQRMQSEGVDYSHSFGYFHEGALTGFVLYSFKTDNNVRLARNSATGVIPGHRGKGQAMELCETSMQCLRERGVEEIVLEVMTVNHYAIRVYEQCHFKIKRELIYLRQDDTFKERIMQTAPPQLAGIYLRVVMNEEVNWNRFKEFWVWQPSWQNSDEVVRNSGDLLTIVGAFDGETEVGYVILDRKSGKVPQMAVAYNWRRRGVGSLLMDYAIRDSEKALAVINMDASDTAYYHFLLKHGFEEKMRQHEMHLRL